VQPALPAYWETGRPVLSRTSDLGKHSSRCLGKPGGRVVDGTCGIRRQHQPLGDQAVYRCCHVGDVARSGAVSFLERESGITGCEALCLGDGKGDVTAGEVARITLAEASRADIPPSVSTERRLQDMRAQPVNVVAIGIDLWCK
jgi:hypothetical protein